MTWESPSITFNPMKLLLPFLVMIVAAVHGSAQLPLHCGADEMRIGTLKARPDVAEAVIQRDRELEQFTELFIAEAEGRGGGGPYFIPVVFHVIHRFGDGNISREQILDGLSILNNTFRKQAADTADIITAFKPIHADCDIEFRLATKDPEGQCHSGINRIASPLATVGDHSVKELIQWDPGMYLNMYVVTNAAGLAGHAVWPADADTMPQWDGIVIAHDYVGSIGTGSLQRSVVLAHECGHYLNLHHIWGGNNVPGFYYLPVGQASNCNEDDLVGDTPNTIGWDNCNLSASSCGNPVDNVQNVMDYSYCNIMFTEGQKVRMHAALNSSVADRDNLWTNENLIATGVLPEPAPLCAADLRSDVRAVCPHIDNTVSFSNASYHGAPDSLFWTFPGGFPPTSQQEQPTVAYSSPGKHDVILEVFSNGTSATVTKDGYVTVLHDSIQTYPFWESFEGQPTFDGERWYDSSPGTADRWALTDTAAYSGSWCALVDNWNVTTLTVDELYGPPIDLENATQMKLAFKYAFAAVETPTNSTKLQVQMTRNCENSWVTRLTIAGDDLETVPPQTMPFIPTDAGQWQQAVVNVPSSYMVDGLRFRFVFTSVGNNRLFLDDINMDVMAGIGEHVPVASDITVFPVPAREQLSVSFNLMEPTELTLSVLGPLGRMIPVSEKKAYPTGTFTEQLNVHDLAPGLYLLRLETGEGAVGRRFVVR